MMFKSIWAVIRWILIIVGACSLPMWIDAIWKTYH